MLSDSRRIGVETVERNQSGNRGKQREQKVKRNSGRDRKNAILGDAMVDAKSNVPPSLRGDFCRTGGTAAAIAVPVIRGGFFGCRWVAWIIRNPGTAFWAGSARRC